MEDDLTWSFQELKDFVDPIDHARLDTFCNSFHYKLEFSDYHSWKASETFDNYHSGPKVLLGGTELNKVFFEFEGHIIPYMTILHTAGDTFAQILNLTLLKPALTEDLVSLKGLTKITPANELVAKCQQEISSFLISDEFKYLDGFVNTLKHRHLLKQEWTMEMISGGPFQIGFRYEGFQYRGESFPKKWGKDLLELRRPIRRGLVGIGRQINCLLKAAA